MSRLFVLVPLLVWLTRPFGGAIVDVGGAAGAAMVLLLGLGAIVILSAAAGVHAAQRERRHRESSRPAGYVRRFGVLLLNGWFVACVYAFGWDDAVGWALQQAYTVLPNDFPVPATLELPLAVGPIYLAWAAVIGCGWPVVKVRRERRLMWDIDLGREPRPMPSGRSWFRHALRSRLGYAIVPLTAFWLARDIAAVSFWAAGVELSAEMAELLPVATGLLVTITLAPWLLVRTLPTRPLPPGPVRDRLAGFARHCGLRGGGGGGGGGGARLLVWDTEHSTANALAVGFLPGLRYVLLSDLLLESLRPEHVEAVLAHEVGHVRHRHMAWLLLFFIALSATLGGPVALGTMWLLDGATIPAWVDWTASVLIMVGVVLAFGYVMRRFERQADLFAARAMQRRLAPATADLSLASRPTLGPIGAQTFATALQRAMRVNGVPPEPSRLPPGLPGVVLWLAQNGRSFLHGTALSRERHLAQLAASPPLAERFDRRMLLFRLAILLTAAGNVAFLLLAQ